MRYPTSSARSLGIVGVACLGLAAILAVAQPPVGETHPSRHGGDVAVPSQPALDGAEQAPAAGVELPPALPESAKDPGPAQSVPADALSDTALRRASATLKAGRRPAGAQVTGDRIRVEAIATPGQDGAAASRALGGTVVASHAGITLVDVDVDALKQLEDDPRIGYVRLPRAIDGPADRDEPRSDLLRAPGSNDRGGPSGMEPPAGGPSSVRMPATSDAPDASFSRAPHPAGALSGPSARRAVAGVGTGRYGLDAVQKTRIGAWQRAGYRGQGVKVGVIDGFNGPLWTAAARAGEVPAAPAGTFCLTNGASCNIYGTPPTNGHSHGVGVVEAVKDAAPAATIYLGSANSITDYYALVDYFAANGVKIITRSLGAHYDGPGDGTGDLDSVVTYAASKGIAWFNSAGNQAGRYGYAGTYFRSAWVDPDGDGWMNFPGGSQFMPLQCAFVFGLRWNDWGANRTDYDVYVFTTPNAAGYVESLSSFNTQQGTSPAEPLEFPTCSKSGSTFYIAIKVRNYGNGTAGDILEFMINSSIRNWTNPYSAAASGVDHNLAAAAGVGAVDPVEGLAIANYSSQGPTNDGRIKPDFSAASGFTSYTYRDSSAGFNGTSAATPIAAGSAATILSAYPGSTAVQLVEFMRNTMSQDRGAAGSDTTYGRGEITFGGTGSVVKAAYLAPRATQMSRTSVPMDLVWNVDALTGTYRYDVTSSENGGSWHGAGTAYWSAPAFTTSTRLGGSRQFQVKIVDYARFTNPTYTTPRFGTRFVDERSGSVRYKGTWVRSRAGGAMKSGIKASSSTKARARLAFTGSAVAAVVHRVPGAGKVVVYIDGVRAGTYGTRAGKSSPRRIIANFYFGGVGRHSIMLRPVGGKPVRLDGFIVVR